jgi:tetratricopeptide (TPR) repeat protein
MASKGRWLTWVLPLVFLGLICIAAWSLDSDFWRTASSLERLAQAAAAGGDHARAVDLARKAWFRQPENPASAALLARLLLDAGNPREALEVCRKVPGPGAGPNYLMTKALALERLGEPEKALELLTAPLREQPDDRDLLETAALIASRPSDHHPLAIDYYRRLHQLRMDPGVRRQLLELLVTANRYQEAIPLQEEEAAQFPEDREALHRLALLYYWRRDYKAAGRIYQGLLTKAAGDAALRLEAAQNAVAAQDPDQALAHYLWLYAHHRGKKEHAVALARLWAQKGNHAEAAGAQ